MPAQFHIGMPTEEQRNKILRLVLNTEPKAEDVDFNRLSKLTNGFSGSDLRELCRNASVHRIREFMKETDKINNGRASSSSDLESPPPICMQDLLSSFAKMKESKLHTGMLSEHRIELDWISS